MPQAEKTDEAQDNPPHTEELQDDDLDMVAAGTSSYTRGPQDTGAARGK